MAKTAKDFGKSDLFLIS